MCWDVSHSCIATKGRLQGFELHRRHCPVKCHGKQERASRQRASADVGRNTATHVYRHRSRPVLVAIALVWCVDRFTQRNDADMAFISGAVASSSEEAFWNVSGANVSGKARCVRGGVSDIDTQFTLMSSHFEPPQFCTGAPATDHDLDD